MTGSENYFLFQKHLWQTRNKKNLITVLISYEEYKQKGSQEQILKLFCFTMPKVLPTTNMIYLRTKRVKSVFSSRIAILKAEIFFVL